MPQQKKQVGRKHTHWLGFWRYPRFIQEKRQAQEGWERAKRGKNSLPDDRNEYITHRDRCWKSYRKTQYKWI